MNDSIFPVRIVDVRNYLKKEVEEKFPKYQIIELDIPAEIEYKARYNELHKELIQLFSSQESDKEYYYLVVNKDRIDLSDKIVYSNNKYHVVYETYYSRFSFFDESFNYIGEATDVLSQNHLENAVHGKSFSIERVFDFNLNFETSQFKKIGLSINKDYENVFDISASGKNKVKKIKFDYQKKHIKAEIVNCFIKNIIFDLQGNIQSIGIKNKISKELFLNKTEFAVNNYNDLIKAVENDLDLYNLTNDANLDIINQTIFNAQVALVKNLIAYKPTINNKVIYQHIDSIKEFFNNINIEPIYSGNFNNDKEFEKYQSYFDRINNDNYHYRYSNQTLAFLASLKIKKIDFDYFLNETILNHFKELNVFSDGFRDLFKEDIKNNKQQKIKR